jgi:hypothetical protein
VDGRAVGFSRWYAAAAAAAAGSARWAVDDETSRWECWRAAMDATFLADAAADGPMAVAHGPTSGCPWARSILLLDRNLIRTSIPAHLRKN